MSVDVKRFQNSTNGETTTNGKVLAYVVKMFRVVENNTTVRPRRAQHSWVDSSTNRFIRNTPAFSINEPHKNDVRIFMSTDRSEANASKGMAKKIYGQLEKYFENTTLHGLRYVGDAKISFGERLFWLVAFLGAIAFAGYFINSIYQKYNITPVIISLNPNPTSLSQMPFPAITICNMNQAKKNQAELIMSGGLEVEKMLLGDFCNANSSFTNITAASSDSTKWDNVMKFILKVNPSCQEILKECRWRSQEIDCDYIFNSALTDEGLCCTFNQLPRTYIFRNARELGDLNTTFPPEVDDWSPERGYSKNASILAIPWRPGGAGAHLGLSLILDANVDNYFCSSTSSTGFKVLLHNPLEIPRMAGFSFFLANGFESRVIIMPTIYDAQDTLRNIDISKRNCFFANEKELSFYRTYTEKNCLLECQANYTLKKCNCVPFFLPKNRQTKICGKDQEFCIFEARESLESPTDKGTLCSCRPACFELNFEGAPTFGKLNAEIPLSDNILKNYSADYFVKNMAAVNFFFLSSQFTRFSKSELYGFSEFLSNTGGLLGLFLGFSFLSAVEVVYYLSLKVFCSFIRSHKRRGKIVQRDPNTILPFAK